MEDYMTETVNASPMGGTILERLARVETTMLDINRKLAMREARDQNLWMLGLGQLLQFVMLTYIATHFGR
jgi:hypothetical protein